MQWVGRRPYTRLLAGFLVAAGRSNILSVLRSGAQVGLYVKVVVIQLVLVNLAPSTWAYGGRTAAIRTVVTCAGGHLNNADTSMYPEDSLQ